VNESEKYSRTLHAPISLGTTSDDRIMPTGFLDAFAEMDELDISEKGDGQNNDFNEYGVFARSHTSPSVHPWDKPMWDRWQLIKNDLKYLKLDLFGENMYAIHSIAYSKLESFFYVFSVRQKGVWLSKEEVRFYANLFDFPVVPGIPVKFKLKEFIKKGVTENQALENWLNANMGMSWLDYVETPGQLGGFDPTTLKPCCEGLVIRNAAAFTTNGGKIKTAENEFNNVFKLVRAKHVKTDEHWTKHWKPATLIDYEKYKWYGFEYQRK
jgi:hypothetical protein